MTSGNGLPRRTLQRPLLHPLRSTCKHPKMRSDQSCHVRLAILILATLSSLFATIGFLSYAGLLPSTLPFGSRLRDSSDSYLFLQLEKGSKNVFFKEHDSYKDLSHDSDHLWNEQITPNGGFLKVVQGDSEARDYGIAMFHQLHCVAMIREEMQMLHRMINPLGRKHEHASSNNATLKHDSKHVMHCFDYLRQVGFMITQ